MNALDFLNYPDFSLEETGLAHDCILLEELIILDYSNQEKKLIKRYAQLLEILMGFI